MAKEEVVPTTSTRKPRFFYGYIIVASGFFIMLVIHGIINTFGVFFNPLLADFNTTRAALSGVNSLAFLVMGFLTIFMGILNDRFGPRTVLTGGALVFAIGCLLMWQADVLWQAYLFFIIMSIGSSASDVVPLSAVVRWFVKRRGAMTGLVKVGTGLGMTVMPLVASALISAFEWRNSYLILSILTFIVTIPLAQLFRRNPREMGLLPDSEKLLTTERLTSVEEGLSLREAIRTPPFWMVCGFYLTTVFCGMTILVHIIPHAVDLNIPKSIAAGIVSTIGGASILGRLVMGFSGDKIGHKRAIVVCFLIAVISLSWLQIAGELWMLYLFAVVYGFAHGGFYALTSPLIAGLFGIRSQGTLLGIVIFSGTVGGSIGMVLAGYIFDVTNSYQLAFLILLILESIGLILALLIRPVDRRKTDVTAG